MSQHARPRIEPAFGWLKTIGWMRKVKLRGLDKVELMSSFRTRSTLRDTCGSAPKMFYSASSPLSDGSQYSSIIQKGTSFGIASLS
jgi:hypothetical protein